MTTDVVAPTSAWAGSGPRRRGRFGVAFWIGVAVIALVVLVATLGPLLAPYSPVEQDLTARLQGPSAAHWLGTDALGRDLLTRLIYGAQVSLIAIAETLIIATLFGTVPGLIAGYLGGRTDMILSRIADLFIIFPGLLFAIALIGVLGPGLVTAMFAVGILMSPLFFRVVRASAQTIRQEQYITAARVLGVSPIGVITKHYLPNMWSPIIVQLTIGASFALIAEASLSFLGLGVQPPDASWGSLIRDGQAYLSQSAWNVLVPAFAIVILALSFSAVGEGLERRRRLS